MLLLGIARYKEVQGGEGAICPPVYPQRLRFANSLGAGSRSVSERWREWSTNIDVPSVIGFGHPAHAGRSVSFGQIAADSSAVRTARWRAVHAVL